MKNTKIGFKSDEGKMLAGCLIEFRHALQAVAEVFTYGAKKYKRRSWPTIPDGLERYTDAKWRHLLAGDSKDKESGLSHAAHEAWNTLACLELTLRKNK